MPLLIVPIVLSVVAIADILSGDALHARFLPQWAWVAIVVLVPVVGAVLWFAVGVERGMPPEATPDDVRELRKAVRGR